MVGTIVTVPIRVDYMNGDYDKAYDLITNAKIKIVYKTVASVEPYHATIHVLPQDAEKVKKLLDKAGIKHYPPTPFY
jgi:mono/diheme cytochrome c family protein